MSPTDGTDAATAEIRPILDKWVEALAAFDVEKILSFYTEDVLSFDAILALHLPGKEALRKHWHTSIEQCPGKPSFEMHHSSIRAQGGLAVVTALFHCGATLENGEQMGGWLRMTLSLVREDGTWRINHEHWSSPFDPATEKVLSLTPEHSQGKDGAKP